MGDLNKSFFFLSAVSEFSVVKRKEGVSIE